MPDVRRGSGRMVGYDYSRNTSASAPVLSPPRKRRAPVLETVALVVVIVVGVTMCACMIAAAAVLVVAL